MCCICGDNHLWNFFGNIFCNKYCRCCLKQNDISQIDDVVLNQKNKIEHLEEEVNILQNIIREQISVMKKLEKKNNCKNDNRR